MFNHDGSMFFGGGFMWIFWILLIVILLVVVKAITGQNNDNNRLQNETPMDILKARYAKGEIDDEEFERRRKELES